MIVSGYDPDLFISLRYEKSQAIRKSEFSHMSLIFSIYDRSSRNRW